MVRTVKASLKKVLGRSCLTFEEMETSLAQIEMMVNSRPLRYMQDDVHEILTPSHLLLGRRLLTNYNPGSSIVHKESISYSKRLTFLSELISHYFTRFRREYLNQLQEHHSYAQATSRREYKVPRVGDMVM